ncbi:hypothetical protein PAMP_021761 [Pampus punctatissimus]
MNSQKEQHEAEIRSLEEQHEAAFISLKEQHGAAFNSLKMDATSERAKIMLEAQKNTKICLKERVSEILEEELAQHSKKMEQLEFLLKENMALWKEKDRMHELCSEMEEDLIKVTQKSLSFENEVEQLSIKNQQLREKLKDCSVNLQRHQDMLVKNEAQLVKERQRLSEQHRQKAAEADQLGAELEEERSRRRRLEAVVQEAVIILRHILKESEKTAETERKMQRLLDILESSAPLGTGSNPQGTGSTPPGTDSTPQGTGSACVGGQGARSSGPKSARAETLKLSTDPMFLLNKYRPGDFGLVPRPRWKHNPTASGAAAAQAGSNRLPPLNSTSSFLQHNRQTASRTEEEKHQGAEGKL